MSAPRRSTVYTAPIVCALLRFSAAAAEPAPEPPPAPPAATPAPAAAPAPQGPVVGSVVPRHPPAGEPTGPITPRTVPRTTPEPDLTAADVAADPVPGFESGRVDPGDTDSTLRVIGRGALFVPRLAIDAVLSPFRGALWVNEHYHVTDWYDRIFYNDAMTIGLYPTLSVDTTLGVTAGLKFIDKDLFGEQESLGAQATIGSLYRQIYSVSLDSGTRLGERFKLGLDVGYERRPHDEFYGIGNGTLTDTSSPPAAGPIDPRVDQTAIAAYYRQYRERATLTADLRAWRQLHLRAAGAISEVSFGDPDQGVPLTTIYQPQGLVGLGGFQYGYGELELRWDDRGGVTMWEPHSVISTGQLAAVFAGRTYRLDNGPDYWRYGVDLEKFIRLTEGPRVLIGHFHAEGVTGSRDEVPFTELPALGGPLYLRGYGLDQFRDRVAAFGSVAYEWDLSQWVSARLFVDVGRVYESLDNLSLDHLRAGYGLALEGHSVDSFAVETSIGTSVDGGLFLNLSFNPVYDIDQRVRRR